MGELNKASDERSVLEIRVATLQKDFQNLRRRHEEEKHILAERRVEDIALSLIEVLDNFERARSGMEGHRSKRPALDPFVKGVGMIEDQIKTVFSQLGIAPILAIGETFDPAFHTCLETVHAKGTPDMEIVTEKQRGYTYKGKVLRPSNVIVNRSAEFENKSKNDQQKKEKKD
jgi:molecular chaperone GrpE